MTLKIWWCFRRVRFWLFFNRREAGLAALNEVLTMEPGNVLALTALGFLHGEQENFGEAVACFQRALKVTPNDANTQFNLAFILQKQARHDEAIKAFDAALTINKSIDRAWFGKGMSLAAQQRHAEAVPAFAEAARLQPMNPHALYELGLQYHVLGQRELLGETIAKLKEFDPKVTQQLAQATGFPDTANMAEAR